MSSACGRGQTRRGSDPGSRRSLLLLRRLGGATVGAVAALLYVLVELGAVAGHAQPLQEGAELAGLVLQLAQGIGAVLVEGPVARLAHATTMAAAGAAAIGTAPPLPALLSACPPVLPVLRHAVHPLDGALAPLLNVGPSAAPSAAVPSASHRSTPHPHPSAPYDVGQDRQTDGPVNNEAEHHQHDPGRLAEVVYPR